MFVLASPINHYDFIRISHSTAPWSTVHYNDVIMGAMASQITRFTIVYSTGYSDVDKKNTAVCAGNSPVTGEFPAQMASNTENVSIWWRHYALNLLWHPRDCNLVRDCVGSDQWIFYGFFDIVGKRARKAHWKWSCCAVLPQYFAQAWLFIMRQTYYCPSANKDIVGKRSRRAHLDLIMLCTTSTIFCTSLVIYWFIIVR